MTEFVGLRFEIKMVHGLSKQLNRNKCTKFLLIAILTGTCPSFSTRLFQIIDIARSPGVHEH